MTLYHVIIIPIGLTCTTVIIYLTMITITSSRCGVDDRVISRGVAVNEIDMMLTVTRCRHPRITLATNELSSSSSASPTLIAITSYPDGETGVGDQFGQWVIAPFLALKLNMTYAFHGFNGPAQRWNDWLGWSDCELTYQDIIRRYENVQIHSYGATQRKTIEMQAWAEQQIATLRTAATSSISRAVILQFSSVHIQWPFNEIACHPQLNLVLRQRYCAMRMIRPVLTDVYADDERAKRLIIGIHYRCGDACFNYAYRTTPFHSMATTIRLLHDTLQPIYGAPAFHFFAQPPTIATNETVTILSAAQHFSPLISNITAYGCKIIPHYDLHSHTVLHHLIRSHIIVGSQSSFTWVANLLHHAIGISPGTTPGCKWTVPYNRDTGIFDTNILHQYLSEMFNQSTRITFRSIDQCYNMQ